MFYLFYISPVTTKVKIVKNKDNLCEYPVLSESQVQG